MYSVSPFVLQINSGSVKSGNSKRSKGSRGSKKSAKSKKGNANNFGLDGPEVDMIQVRQIQRTFALLLSSCELDNHTKQELEDIMKAFREKDICNRIVDDFVQKETTKPLRDRTAEQETLIHRQAEHFCCYNLTNASSKILNTI